MGSWHLGAENQSFPASTPFHVFHGWRCDWITKVWVYNFVAGMTGTHTFEGVWTEDGVVDIERTITVNFT